MIGKRLKRARQSAGLSLRDLASKIEHLVSAQAIGKYERNEMMPGFAALLAMAKALDVPSDYLLNERDIELAGIDFRKVPHLDAKQRRAFEVRILDRVERYIELEELMPPNDATLNTFGNEQFDTMAIEDAEIAADSLRSRWEIGIHPIPSMAELLEGHGIKVIALKLAEHICGAKAFVRRPGYSDFPVIVVNQSVSGEQQRFALAHELAHLVLKFPGHSARDQEMAADRFAAAFLMPNQMMKRLLGQNRVSIALGELAELKQIFKVSLEAILLRCRQLGIISRAICEPVLQELAALGWAGPNSEEPNPSVPERPKRMERLCMRAVVEDVISYSKAAELLQISVRELDIRLAGASG